VAERRPSVTFYLYAYNQEATVREACLAALAQDYPSEIIFSDDCSKDRTFAVMAEVAASYAGPHAVRLNRNETNLGLVRHVNRSMELAAGELVVAAAGDDASVPERTRRLVEAYLAAGGRANSIHSAVQAIDARTGAFLGVRRPPILRFSTDPDDLALRHSLVFGATHAWTRRVFEVFGPIAYAGTYEDLIIAFRSALLGPIAYVDEPLVRYRVGHGMTTAPWRSTLRSIGAATARKRLATLEQRRVDYRTIGRSVPGALDRAIACERVWSDAFGGEFGRALRAVVRSPRLGWDAARQAGGWFSSQAWGAIVRRLAPPGGA